jgi:hypothetical protein
VAQEAKPAEAEVISKPTEEVIQEEAKPVQVIETKESKKRTIEEVSNQDTELL